MKNYLVWKNEHNTDIVVQVFHKEDLPSVQEQIAKQGYVICETFMIDNRKFYFVAGRLKDE